MSPLCYLYRPYRAFCFSLNLLLCGQQVHRCGRYRFPGCFQLRGDHAGYHLSGNHDIATEGIDDKSQGRTAIALCILAQQHSP